MSGEAAAYIALAIFVLLFSWWILRDAIRGNFGEMLTRKVCFLCGKQMKSGQAVVRARDGRNAHYACMLGTSRGI